MSKPFDIDSLTDEELANRQMELQRKMYLAMTMCSGAVDAIQQMLEQVETVRNMRLSDKMWGRYIDNTKSVISSEETAKTENKKTSAKKTFKKVDGSPIVKTSSPIKKKD